MINQLGQMFFWQHGSQLPWVYINPHGITPGKDKLAFDFEFWDHCCRLVRFGRTAGLGYCCCCCCNYRCFRCCNYQCSHCCDCHCCRCAIAIVTVLMIRLSRASSTDFVSGLLMIFVDRGHLRRLGSSCFESLVPVQEFVYLNGCSHVGFVFESVKVCLGEAVDETFSFEVVEDIRTVLSEKACDKGSDFRTHNGFIRELNDRSSIPVLLGMDGVVDLPEVGVQIVFLQQESVRFATLLMLKKLLSISTRNASCS